MRVKYKKDSYKQLHLLGSSPNDKRLVRAILQDEGDELATVGSFAERITKFARVVEGLLTSLRAILDKHKAVEKDKDFAMAIKDEKHYLKFLLFPLRKGQVQFDTIFDNESILNKVVDIVYKLLGME